MNNMYDIEQNIMKCWQVCDDLETIFLEVGDGDKQPTPDELVNTLMGIQQLYQWKFSQLFESYENVLRIQRKDNNMTDDKWPLESDFSEIPWNNKIRAMDKEEKDRAKVREQSNSLTPCITCGVLTKQKWCNFCLSKE